MARVVKNPPANAGDIRDIGLIPGLGRCPGEGSSYPLQYSGLENSMECIVHAVAKSPTRLSNFHFTSSIHAWRTPRTEEPGRLQSIGLQGQTRLKQLSTHAY